MQSLNAIQFSPRLMAGHNRPFISRFRGDESEEVRSPETEPLRFEKKRSTKWILGTVLTAFMALFSGLGFVPQRNLPPVGMNDVSSKADDPNHHRANILNPANPIKPPAYKGKLDPLNPTSPEDLNKPA